MGCQMGDTQARVLDVGQCNLDHGNIRRLLEEQFAAVVDRADSIDRAMEMACGNRGGGQGGGGYDLVLVNRLLDADGSEGLDLVRRMRADERTRDVPVMLVSNFADAHVRAQQEGAAPGFGKSNLDEPATRDLLGRFLRK